MIEEIVNGIKDDFGIASLALHCDKDGWTASAYHANGISVGNPKETIADALASLVSLFEEGWDQ